MTKLPVMKLVVLQDDGPLESGSRVRSSGSSRFPTFRQGLSRLFQIPRTTPTTSDRNSNNICHSAIGSRFSGSNFKSKLRLAAQSDPTSSSREAVHDRANHRRRNEEGDEAATECPVPLVDKTDASSAAATPSKVRANQSRRNFGGGVSLDDAHCLTANSDEWAGPDLTRANSVRSNHCRTKRDAGDNNGNTAVPRIDWSGTDKTSGINQESKNCSWFN